MSLMYHSDGKTHKLEVALHITKTVLFLQKRREYKL